MLKSLWSTVTFLAVVHLLALLMLVAWMWQSGRLNGDRVSQIRELLAAPQSNAKAEADQRLAEAEIARLEAEEAARRENPSSDSGTQIKQVAAVQYAQEQARRRLEDERRMLLQQLHASADKVTEDAAALNQRREQWKSAVSGEQERKNDQQFLQTVKQYEQVSPKQGKKMIMELVNRNQTAQAIAYLDAMSPRASAKIIKEFKTDPEIALATELLEKLRTFGLEGDESAPSDAAETSGDASSDSAQ